MRLRDFITRMFKFDKPNRNPEPTDQVELIIKMAQSLEITEAEEYSCTETYELLDQYVELIKRGDAAAKLMPLVERHLSLCPDCHEEYKALLRILRNQTD